MSVIFVLLPLSLLVGAIAVGVFLWAVRDGQFDDLDAPALRMLDDDDESDESGDPDEETHSTE